MSLSNDRDLFLLREKLTFDAEGTSLSYDRDLILLREKEFIDL